MTIKGLLFDKDGTLFDFAATWNVWAAGMIEDFADGDAALAQAIATSAMFDLERKAFDPKSPIIAGTADQAIACVARAIPGADIQDVGARLNASAANAPLAPAADLPDLLGGFRGEGLKLGVMTNDAESVAEAHLAKAGVRGLFDMVIGFDSGYGAKPAPEPLLAFSKAVDLDPGSVAMVGDSTHDLVAGRSAGMVTIAVLTGVAQAPELQPYADVVLPDIGHIPDWLSARA